MITRRSSLNRFLNKIGNRFLNKIGNRAAQHTIVREKQTRWKETGEIPTPVTVWTPQTARAAPRFGPPSPPQRDQRPSRCPWHRKNRW
ncbi:hypothetical protein SAMN04489712_111271 [Thermomonospora echinospora]|uniref:Uncharacterized protein n=1 Tax=Thermomonospora echinospora TaxID=1992 RepID=A0A1H6CY00_9ACTN|nr:hypothetical protein SAMN04489712_111271 [Thermomonospora echinospora]